MMASRSRANAMRTIHHRDLWSCVAGGQGREIWLMTLLSFFGEMFAADLYYIVCRATAKGGDMHISS